MVDPTWIRTCPCGAKVRVNMLGQHHHHDCEYNPLHPGCCDDPSLRREFYHLAGAGVRCHNCGHRWRGARGAYRRGIADRLTEAREGFQTGRVRGEVFRSNHALVRRLADG